MDLIQVKQCRVVGEGDEAATVCFGNRVGQRMAGGLTNPKLIDV